MIAHLSPDVLVKHVAGATKKMKNKKKTMKRKTKQSSSCR